jgi:hypothetical protein
MDGSCVGGGLGRTRIEERRGETTRTRILKRTSGKAHLDLAQCYFSPLGQVRREGEATLKNLLLFLLELVRYDSNTRPRKPCSVWSLKP